MVGVPKLSQATDRTLSSASIVKALRLCPDRDRNMYIAHGNLYHRPNEQELIGVARQRLASAARVAGPVTPETPNTFNVGQTCIRRRAIIHNATCRCRSITLPYVVFSGRRARNKASADLRCRTLLIQAVAGSVRAQEQELI